MSKVRLGISWVALAFFGCTKGGGGELVGATAELVEVSDGARRAALPIDGGWFGEVELIAYDYRPGLTVAEQTGGGVSYLNNDGNRLEPAVYGSDFGDPGIGAMDLDFSTWPVVLSGHDAARDVYLELGGTADLDALGTVGGTTTQYPPDATYSADIGRFDIDFLEVWMGSMGAVVDGVFYGNTPQNDAGWASGVAATDTAQSPHPITGDELPTSGTTPPTIPSYVADTILPMWPPLLESSATTPRIGADAVNGVSVLLVRNDWLSEATLVRMDDPGYDGNTTGPYPGASVAFSSAPLDSSVEDFLVALLEQGQARRREQNFVLVPFTGVGTGPVRVILDASVTGHASWDTSNADTVVDLTGVTSGTGGMNFSVEYDLSMALDSISSLPVDSSTSPAPDPSTLLPRPTLVFTSDTNGVPFGISASAVDRPATCFNGTQDTGEDGVDCGGEDCKACFYVPEVVDCAGNAPAVGLQLYQLTGSVQSIGGTTSVDYAAANVAEGAYVTAWMTVDSSLTDSDGRDFYGAYSSSSVATGKLVMHAGDLCVEAATLSIEVSNDGVERFYVDAGDLTATGVTLGSTGTPSLEIELEGSGSDFEDELPTELPPFARFLDVNPFTNTLTLEDGDGGTVDVWLARGR